MSALVNDSIRQTSHQHTVEQLRTKWGRCTTIVVNRKNAQPGRPTDRSETEPVTPTSMWKNMNRMRFFCHAAFASVNSILMEWITVFPPHWPMPINIYFFQVTVAKFSHVLYCWNASFLLSIFFILYNHFQIRSFFL